MDPLFSVLCAMGGGALVAIIQAFAQRGKVKVESDSVSLKNALDLEQVAMDRYTSTEEKLNKIRGELKEVEAELLFQKAYAAALTALLHAHEIKYPTEAEVRNGPKHHQS